MSIFEKKLDKSGSPQESVKKSLLGRILSPAEKAAKMTMILSILSGPLQAAPDGDKEGNPEGSKNSIEDARQALGKIIPFVEKQDNSLLHTLGYTNIKTFKSNDGRELISAVDKSFVILSIGDGHYTYLDNNSDGILDRLVINNEEKPEDRSLVKNGLYAFNSMDNLFRQAAVVAELRPEKIKTLSFDLDKMEITYVDAEDGTSGVIGGDKAKAAIEKFQRLYAEKLQQMAADQAN